MGNAPFEDVSPMKEWWFSIAMLVYQRGNCMTFGLDFVNYPSKKIGTSTSSMTLTSETIPTIFLPRVTWMCFHPYDLPCILETRLDDSWTANLRIQRGLEKFTRVICMMNSNFINLDDYQMICCYLQEVSKYLYIYTYPFTRNGML